MPRFNCNLQFPFSVLHRFIKKTIRNNNPLSWSFTIDWFDMQFIAEPGIGHHITKFQVNESSDWFDRFLKPESVSSEVLFKSRV